MYYEGTLRADADKIVDDNPLRDVDDSYSDVYVKYLWAFVKKHYTGECKFYPSIGRTLQVDYKGEVMLFFGDDKTEFLIRVDARNDSVVPFMKPSEPLADAIHIVESMDELSHMNTEEMQQYVDTKREAAIDTGFLIRTSVIK